MFVDSGRRKRTIQWRLLLGLAVASLIAPTVFGGESGAPQSSEQTSHISKNGLFRYHKMNEQDIEIMKRTVGVREPGVNYNVIVDGFGTGYAPPTLEEYDAMLGSVNVVNALTAAASDGRPDALDLSDDPRFPKVDSQGGQGSCAAWATTYYTYGYAQALYFDWTQASLGDVSQLMSPAWTYNKANSGSDTGSSDTSNSWVIRDWGCATWEYMPYDDDDFTSWGDEAAYRNAMDYYPGEVFTYSTNTEPDPAQKIEMVKSVLNSGSALTIFVWASFYGDGVYDDYILTAVEMDWETKSGPHLNAIVGYDDALEANGEVGAFRVVNSWGEDFADGGFYWMTYDAYLSWDHSHLWFEDPAHTEPTLLAVWEFSDPGSRDGTQIIYNGDDTDDIRSDHSDFVMPWAAGGDHSYPPFMCCRIDGMIDAWGSTDFFYLYMEYADTRSTVSSFHLEYYDQEYTANQPTDVSDYCDETPAREPFAIGLRYPYRDFPTVPSNPDPADGTVKVSVDGTLSWDCTDPEEDALSYDVHFGTDPAPPLAVEGHPADTYSPGSLSYDTVYYWQIVASDGNGHTAEGPVWSFITEVDEEDMPPDVPSNPYPADGELAANPHLLLTWESDDPNVYDTVTRDVYFGESGQMELVADDISENQYQVNGLDTDQHYEWKVVAFDDTGLSTEGPVWSFKTKTEEELLILIVNAKYEKGSNEYFTDRVGIWLVDEFSSDYVGQSGEEIIIDEPGTYTIELKPSFLVNTTLYVFDHWEETGSTLNPITVEIIDDVTLTAVYKKSKGPGVIPL